MQSPVLSLLDILAGSSQAGRQGVPGRGRPERGSVRGGRLGSLLKRGGARERFESGKERVPWLFPFYRKKREKKSR